MTDTNRTLVVVIHEGTDQLAGVHIAESELELHAVVDTVAGVGPLWTFPLVEGELLQWWEADQ